MQPTNKTEYDQLFQLNEYAPKDFTFKESLIEKLLKENPTWKRWRLRDLSVKQLFLITNK